VTEIPVCFLNAVENDCALLKPTSSAMA